MIDPTPSPRAGAAPLNGDEEARELEEFFRRQNPVDLAAADWHTRLEQGLSATQQAELQQWLAASPAHAAAMRRLDRGMALLRSLPADALAAARHPAAPAPASAPRAARPRQARWAWLLPRPAALALCCTAILAVGVGWHQWQQWQQQPTFTSAYAAKAGQRLDTTLPDGSELLIDADTQTQVALYRDRREVRLGQGQAMFRVAADAARPFIVLAGSARVTVVGTRFSVRYRTDGADGGSVNVAVEEGRVRVDGLGAEGATAPGSVELAAGQGVHVSPEGAVGAVAALPPGSAAPWLKGLVRFDSSTLADALRELERYGPTRLVIRDPQVAAMRIGGSYQIGRPAAFAQVLPQILPVRLVAGSDGITEIVRAR